MDFSQLCVWGVYLRGHHARDVDFTGADLAGSVFTDTFYRVDALAFSPDASLFASATGFGTIHLWHGNGESAGLLRGISGAIWTLAFSPDGRYLASNGEDWAICLWDVQQRQIRQRLTGHSSLVTQVLFHPSGNLLASAGRDGTIHLWDLRAPTDGNPCSILPARQGDVVCIAFRPDGTLLASGGDDHRICLWNVETGDLVATLAGHTQTVRALAFHPETTHQQGLLASASWDSTIQLWDLSIHQPRAILHGHPVPITALVFSPNGRYLASGGTEPLIRLWDVATGQQCQILNGHNGWINALAFRPDARYSSAPAWIKRSACGISNPHYTLKFVHK